MKNKDLIKQIDIDTGRAILTLSATATRKGPLATAYINNMSVRCGSLHIERMANRFIDCVLVAADLEEKDPEQVEKQLVEFIDSIL